MSENTLSDAQLAANRENAKKSTGPRSIEGKQRSRNNSWKHGLTGATALLPSDDRDAYELYVNGIVDSLHPGSLLEHEICRDVADAHWRLRRVFSVESKMLTLPAVVPPPAKIPALRPLPQRRPRALRASPCPTERRATLCNPRRRPPHRRPRLPCRP